MENDSKKTLQLLDATSATNLVTSKQIAPQTSNGLRRVIRKAMKKEGPRRLTSLGMTMIHPKDLKRRKSIFYAKEEVMILHEI